MKRLKSDFFDRDTLTVAKELLGKVLVRRFKDIFLRLMIVEVESYLGEFDRAAHTYGRRHTKRNHPMYMKAGTYYIYFTYGMHYLLNIVTEKEDIPNAILIRAAEPLDNLNIISQNRFLKDYEDLNSYQRKNLTNGPAKLTKALDIDLKLNSLDINCRDLFLEEYLNPKRIYKSKRIGVEYAKEDSELLYRFFMDSKYVSRSKNKTHILKEEVDD